MHLMMKYFSSLFWIYSEGPCECFVCLSCSQLTCGVCWSLLSVCSSAYCCTLLWAWCVRKAQETLLRMLLPGPAKCYRKFTQQPFFFFLKRQVFHYFTHSTKKAFECQLASIKIHLLLILNSTILNCFDDKDPNPKCYNKSNFLFSKKKKGMKFSWV